MTEVKKCWPMWRKVLAYLVLVLLAGVSIWFIDSRAVVRTNDDGKRATARP